MNALYTGELTPRLDVPEEFARLIFEGKPKHPVRLHFERLKDEDRRSVIAYCEELDCLHEDLGFLAEELDDSVADLYRRSFYRRRLAIIYHSDHLDFRVHAYREQVFKLVNHFLGLKLVDRLEVRGSSADESTMGFNHKVLKMLEATKRLDLVTLLGAFRRDKALNQALKLRRLLAHAQAVRESEIISAARRVDDQEQRGSASEKIDRETDLDRLYEKVDKRVTAVHKRLEQFRRDLVAELERVVTRR